MGISWWGIERYNNTYNRLFSIYEPVIGFQGEKMKIEKIVEGNRLTIKLDGRLDTNTAPELDEELGEILSGVQELIFDFGDLKYISSAGLRLILSTQKTMNQQGTLVIENVNDMVMEIFETTGFADVLTIKEK